jgi:hypothetical protein
MPYLAYAYKHNAGSTAATEPNSRKKKDHLQNAKHQQWRTSELAGGINTRLRGYIYTTSRKVNLWTFGKLHA